MIRSGRGLDVKSIGMGLVRLVGPSMCLLVCLGVSAAGPRAARAAARDAIALGAATVIGFDQKTDGTVVVDDYAGVTFEPLLGHLPVVEASSKASSPPNIVNISTCGCENYSPGLRGRFSSGRSRVSMLVGLLAARSSVTATLTLRAMNARGDTIAQSTVTATGGFFSKVATPVSVESTAGDIAAFELSASPGDDGKNIGVDDLSFEDPVLPPAPDFSLSASPPGLNVRQGAQATTTIDVHRLNGSTGLINFNASGLPAGVTATFTELGDDQATLTLAADADAPPSEPTQVTISGAPAVASAGAVAEPTRITVNVVGDYTLAVQGDRVIDLAPCSVNAPIAVTREASFADNVTLTASGLPAGVQASFAPATLSFPGGVIEQISTLTLTATQHGIAIPTATITVHATSGSLPEQNTTLNVFGSCGRPQTGRDVDSDGITDSLERKLLAKFRPYYRFSTNRYGDEQDLPTDAISYVRWSALRNGSDASSAFIRNAGAFAADPSGLLAVDCHEPPPYCGSSLLGFPFRSEYHLDVPDSLHYGFDPGDGQTLDQQWTRVEQQGNRGLYGHVARDGNGNYKIEYWQFYAYNNTDLNLAGNPFDHEGDWEGVQLAVSRQTLALISVSHFVHGSEIKFQMRGSHLATLQDRVAEYRGPNYDTTNIQLSSQPGLDEAQNNLLRLYCDNDNGDASSCTHPVAYIEFGTHASWPSEHWIFIGAPSHNGNGQHYLTKTPTNLGEVDHPNSQAAAIILRYNGVWGAYTGTGASNPPGPALHKSWTWPANSPLQPCSSKPLPPCIPESAFE